MSFITKDPLLGATLNNLALEVERSGNARAAQIGSDNSFQLKGQVVRQQQEITQLQAENQYYKQLLCKPMAEIAAKDGNFKKTFEAQQQIMADWMVSQKAFKELAIEFGFEDGLSAEEVIQKGNAKEIDVLESKHDESHNTNANNSSIIRPYVEKLKEKIQNK